jgi:26S proteasome non-ATPase regulatory subunit 9
MTPQEEADIKLKEAQRLLKRKDELEAKIREQDALLASHNVTKDTPLVDAQGFPRSDIDVASIVQIRHQIAVLRTDLKECIDQLEKAMYAAHAAAKIAREANPTTTTTSSTPKQRPFIRVEQVDHASPASEAGLQVGDEILVFGTLTADNYKQLSDLAELVQRHEDRSVALTVQRRQGTTVTQHHLTLYPRRDWGGRGLIG